MDEEKINETLYKRTVIHLLKPLREKWKLKNYSLVIERVFYEWAQMKEERKKHPSIIAEDIKKLLDNKNDNSMP